MREREAPRAAHQQLHTQTLLQRVKPTPHDGRRHALGLGSGGQAATRGDRDKGFELLELVHGDAIVRQMLAGPHTVGCGGRPNRHARASSTTGSEPWMGDPSTGLARHCPLSSKDQCLWNFKFPVVIEANDVVAFTVP